VAPIDADAPYLFGRQDAVMLNGAVLRLPPDAPLLSPLQELFEERIVPFWLEPDSRQAAAQSLRESGRTGLSHMPWGTAGPGALTALAKRHGVDHLAQPEAVFYPVPYSLAAWILNPDIQLTHVVRDGTVAVHLWNELIKDYKDAPAPPGSFLARLHAEGR
jgi:hypothetical protein